MQWGAVEDVGPLGPAEGGAAPEKELADPSWVQNDPGAKTGGGPAHEEKQQGEREGIPLRPDGHGGGGGEVMRKLGDL